MTRGRDPTQPRGHAARRTPLALARARAALCHPAGWRGWAQACDRPGVVSRRAPAPAGHALARARGTRPRPPAAGMSPRAAHRTVRTRTARCGRGCGTRGAHMSQGACAMHSAVRRALYVAHVACCMAYVACRMWHVGGVGGGVETGVSRWQRRPTVAHAARENPFAARRPPISSTCRCCVLHPTPSIQRHTPGWPARAGVSARMASRIFLVSQRPRPLMDGGGRGALLLRAAVGGFGARRPGPAWLVTRVSMAMDGPVCESPSTHSTRRRRPCLRLLCAASAPILRCNDRPWHRLTYHACQLTSRGWRIGPFAGSDRRRLVDRRLPRARLRPPASASYPRKRRCGAAQRHCAVTQRNDARWAPRE